MDQKVSQLKPFLSFCFKMCDSCPITSGSVCFEGKVGPYLAMLWCTSSFAQGTTLWCQEWIQMQGRCLHPSSGVLKLELQMQSWYLKFHGKKKSMKRVHLTLSGSRSSARVYSKLVYNSRKAQYCAPPPLFFFLFSPAWRCLGYSWLCTQEFPYGIPRIQSAWAACKANVLPMVLLLWPVALHYN